MSRRPHPRDYLTRREMLALLRAARHSRYGTRNYAMILRAHARYRAARARLRIPDETRSWRIIYRIDHDAIVIGATRRRSTHVPQSPTAGGRKRPRLSKQLEHA